MSIKDKIKSIRTKIDERREMNSFKRNKRQAERLSSLKMKRERLEGKSRLRNLEYDERERIKKARRNIYEKSFAGKVQKSIKKVKKNSKKLGSISRKSLVTSNNSRVYSRKEGVLRGNVDRNILNIKR